MKLLKFCQRKKIILFIDEVYYPFGKSSFFNLLDKYNNLIVARSFSKAFGLAGIRLGYILTNKKLTKYISNSRTAYETNTLSLATASFFIDHYSEISKYVIETKKGIDFIKTKLDKLKIHYHGGNQGNFIFINFYDFKKNKDVIKYLESKKIFVRGGWQKPWNTGFSLSCGPKQLMQRFYKHFVNALDTINAN